MRAKEPSAIAASMRGRSWSTGRPAPRLRWPTSLLPIWPTGRPTASPDASSRQCGHVASSARQRGIGGGGDRVRRRVRPEAEAIDDDEDDGPRSMQPATVMDVPPFMAALHVLGRSRVGGRGVRRGGTRQSICARCRRVSVRAGGDARSSSEARARDDAGHLVELEAGTADERAVDGRLVEELADRAARHRAAIEDRAAPRHRLRAPTNSASVARMAVAISAASGPLAVRPVPIAQTGS